MIGLNKIYQLIKEVINESDVYEARVMMRSSRDRNLTEILDEIRAVCAVTVVNLPHAAQPLSKFKEISELKLKFLLTSPSLKQHLRKMAIAARKIDGIYSFRVINANKIEKR